MMVKNLLVGRWYRKIGIELLLHDIIIIGEALDRVLYRRFPPLHRRANRRLQGMLHPPLPFRFGAIMIRIPLVLPGA
jgi:hypothetical protein